MPGAGPPGLVTSYFFRFGIGFRGLLAASLMRADNR
jgi:hypothetical protein